jgi:hypothetical protein
MTTTYKLIETFNGVSFKLVNFKYRSHSGGEEEGKMSKTKSLEPRCITFLCVTGFFGKTPVSTKKIVKFFYSRVIMLCTIPGAAYEDECLQKVLNLNQ